MDAMITPMNLLGWAAGLFVALVSLLVWKHRKGIPAKRINRGLRSYAATHEVAS
jgi:hypothetical protein